MVRQIVSIYAVIGTILTISAIGFGGVGPGEREPEQKVPPRKILVSPDRRQMAIVTFYPARFYGDPESRVDIWTRHHREITAHDFSSPDGSQGRTVEQAKWSPDSRYFVVTTSSSGGHSPWNFQPYVFSRRRRVFFALECYVKPIVTEEIRFISSHKLKTRFLTGDADFNGPTTVIDLAAIDVKAARYPGRII